MKNALLACVVSVLAISSVHAGVQSRPGVYQPGNGVSAPQLVKDAKPQYTAEAMRRKIEGAVLMEAVIGIEGRVTDIKVVTSLDSVYGLDDAALTAARQWQFKPGMKDNKPVPVLVTIEMAFTLSSKHRTHG
jgi:TonB family protein